MSRGPTVYIGNIAYDATEDELLNLFRSVGPVKDLRLMVDRDTGKRKGFGFIEYTDTESALSAVRNLNEIEFHGRPLRVNISDPESRSGPGGGDTRKRKGGPGGSIGGGVGGSCGGSCYGVSVNASAIGSSTCNRGGATNPSGGTRGGGATDLPAGIMAASELLGVAHEPVAAYVERAGRVQLFELIQQMKHFAATQPDMAADLLVKQPQLYHALQLAIDRLAGPHWPPPPPDGLPTLAATSAATSDATSAAIPAATPAALSAAKPVAKAGEAHFEASAPSDVAFESAAADASGTLGSQLPALTATERPVAVKCEEAAVAAAPTALNMDPALVRRQPKTCPHLPLRLPLHLIGSRLTHHWTPPCMRPPHP